MCVSVQEFIAEKEAIGEARGEARGEAKGLAKGLAEELAEGIRGTIEILRSMDVAYEAIAQKIKFQYNLSDDEVTKYMKLAAEN